MDHNDISIPGEVTRMFLEHLSHRQHVAISRVCRLYRFFLSFPIRIPIKYEYSHDLVICHNPHGIALNYNTGKLFISTNNKIKVFDQQTSELSVFGSDKLNSSRFIAVDPNNGNISTIDARSDLLTIISPNEEVVFRSTCRYSKRGITFDKNSNIIVNDSNQIKILDPTGKYLQSSHVQLRRTINARAQYAGVAVNRQTGNIFAVDSYNCKIRVFDSNAKYLFSFGSKGSGQGKLKLPLYRYYR